MIAQYRCDATGHRAILKWDGSAYDNNWPRKVRYFVKDAGTRKILGRWLPTENASLLCYLQKLRP